MSFDWTIENREQYLIDNYLELGPAKIVKYLGTTPDIVKHHAHKLSIQPKRDYLTKGNKVRVMPDDVRAMLGVDEISIQVSDL